MATISAYETAAGKRYRVRYRTPDHRPTDKRGFRTKREAEAFAATVEVSKLRGEFVAEAAGRVTIGELGERWLPLKTMRKPSYVRTLQGTWDTHVEPRWGSVAVSRVKRSQVQEWITKLAAQRSASVTRRAHNILAGILDLAIDDRAVIANPARGVELPSKHRGGHEYLTLAQVRALADEAGANGPFVWFLATTGLRWGEATALQGKHVNSGAGRVRVERSVTRVGAEFVFGTPKTGERREVPVPASILAGMPATLPEALVWPVPGTGELRRMQKATGWFAGAVKRCQAADEAFPTVTPHDLRHTAASLAVSAGANVKVVQRMLGHASAAMTLDQYADLFDADLDTVATRLEAAIAASAH